MKKLILFLICCATVITSFTACDSNNGNEDAGATIPVYISTEITNFDPAYSNLDDASSKILGLIYEGLFKLNSNGKVEKAQADEIKILDDPSNNYYAIEITLKETSWSDDIKVTAADYIFAWKRILEPGFRGEAASLLFDIKNARAVNSGDASIDDLGVTDVTTDTIKIEFEQKIDYDKFYEYLASPMLVPLREDIINKVEKDWASNPTLIVCNGPFCVRTISLGEKLILERNRYYCRDNEEDSIKSAVTPYRLAIYFTKNSSEDNLANFEAGNIVYDSELPLSKRAEYKDDADIYDSMSVLSYIFNTNIAPFNNVNVRKALSLAIDRNEVVKLLTFATPAEGLISSGVFNTEYGRKAKSFRESAEALISPEANTSAAKDLLKKEGVNGGKITITLRNNEADIAVAEYVKTVWESLGFDVELRKLGYKSYVDSKEYELISDKYLEAYETGDFEVISIDNQMLTTDAFANLAQYAKAFASGKIVSDDFELTPHISGYYNPDYDAKINEAFAEKTNLEKRASLLHEAEKILMNDMPVMPLAELQSAVITSSDISKLDNSYFGYDIFNKAKLSNVSKYPNNVGYVDPTGDETK